MRVVVFDFDGVLADSFSMLYELNREAMSLINIGLSPEQYRNLFGANIHQSFKQLISDEESYKSFIKFKKENFGQRYQDVELFPKISEVLRHLSGHYRLAISSSTLKEFIEKLLVKNKVDACFQYIIGNQDHSKLKGLEEIKNKMGRSYSDMVMVTDTVADLAVAKQLGMATIAVTWGFHDISRLSAATPDAVVNKPEELISSLTSL